MSLRNPETFLDLVQRLGVEAGISDDPIATTIGVSGQQLTLCNMINEASLEIQRLHNDWEFMRVSPGVSFTTIADQMLYTPAQTGIVAADLTRWLLHTFRIYNTSVGTPSEIRMDFLEFDDWRDLYQMGSMRTARVMPMDFSVAPNLSIAIPCPLAGYTITGDYIMAPVGFAEDDTYEPPIPKKYRMAIVWKALLQYSVDESAPEVYAKGSTGYDSLVKKMEIEYLPGISFAGPIA